MPRPLSDKVIVHDRIAFMLSPTLILASASPRRRELLALSGWQFKVTSVDLDEQPMPGEAPDRYVLRLAGDKATAAAETLPSDATILAADTTVADGDTILGKPASAEEAARMLKALRKRTHTVFTALALLAPGIDSPLLELCASSVPMRDYSDEEIHDYVNSGDPLDKAGAYAIQHDGFSPVINFMGCYAGVMGLPLCHFARLMRKAGCLPDAEIPARCQQHLNYHCTIYPAVWRGDNVG